MQKSLLPPNSTLHERALEAALFAALKDISVPIRDVWHPEQCPESLLPWLAWSVGVDIWSPEWPVDLKRRLIKNSMSIHQQKGTVASIERLFALFGLRAELIEWWQQSPQGKPKTFIISLPANDNKIMENTVSTLQQAVNQTKPASTHYSVVVPVCCNKTLGVDLMVSTHSHIHLACQL